MRSRLSLLVAFLVVLPWAGQASAWQAGDLVVLTNAENGIRQGGERVDDPPLGCVFEVRQVQGEWLAVSRGKPGWVWERDVVALSDGVRHFSDLLRRNPGNVEYHAARGNIYVTQGQYKEAIDDFDTALEANPSPWIYNQRGIAYYQSGEYELAIRDFDRCLSVMDDNALTYFNRGESYRLLGMNAEAIRDMSQSLRLDSTNALVFAMRGRAYWDSGQYAPAIEDYRAAAELDEKDPFVRSRLAWLLAGAPVDSLRDGEEAVEIATLACQLSDWQETDAIEALAAAYAETGDFDQAIKYQEQVIEMTGDDSPWAATYASRLEQYEARRPVRFPVVQGAAAGGQTSEEPDRRPAITPQGNQSSGRDTP